MDKIEECMSQRDRQVGLKKSGLNMGVLDTSEQRPPRFLPLLETAIKGPARIHAPEPPEDCSY